MCHSKQPGHSCGHTLLKSFTENLATIFNVTKKIKNKNIQLSCYSCYLFHQGHVKTSLADSENFQHEVSFMGSFKHGWQPSIGPHLAPTKQARLPWSIWVSRNVFTIPHGMTRKRNLIFGPGFLNMEASSMEALHECTHLHIATSYICGPIHKNQVAIQVRSGIACSD